MHYTKQVEQMSALSQLHQLLKYEIKFNLFHSIYLQS